MAWPLVVSFQLPLILKVLHDHLDEVESIVTHTGSPGSAHNVESKAGGSHNRPGLVIISFLHTMAVQGLHTTLRGELGLHTTDLEEVSEVLHTQSVLHDSK